MVTCEPSADVRDVHHRMGVLLEPDQFDTWLRGPQDAAKRLMTAYPDGRLAVAPAADVDWTGP
jgi:putative SOS response-associated peptidase YedK